MSWARPKKKKKNIERERGCITTRKTLMLPAMTASATYNPSARVPVLYAPLPYLGRCWVRSVLSKMTVKGLRLCSLCFFFRATLPPHCPTPALITCRCCPLPSVGSIFHCMLVLLIVWHATWISLSIVSIANQLFLSLSLTLLVIVAVLLRFRKFITNITHSESLSNDEGWIVLSLVSVARCTRWF